MQKITLRFFYLVLGLLVAGQVYAQEKTGPSKVATFKLVAKVPSLADQMRSGKLITPDYSKKGEVNPKKRHGNNVVPGKGMPKGKDPAIQQGAEQQSRSYQPEPLLVFDANIAQFTPSDPTGAVGPNHYVAAWNSGFQIFNKNGNPLTDEASLATLFTNNAKGDPIVLYDPHADRFIITEFEDGNDDPSFENGLNIAVCQGSDPVNDGWYIYTSFDTGSFPDYPKYSIWHDGYYITANISTNSGDSTGDSVFVAERDKMLAGEAVVQFFAFPLPDLQRNGFYSPQFLNVGGGELPATGPNTVVYMQDDAWSGVSDDHLKLWSVSVDWETPENSFITSPVEIVTQDFTGVFDGGSFSNLSQPNGPDIDALQATIMNQAQFRKFDTYNSAIFNFVVDVDAGSADQAGIRWYELRQDGDGQPWSIYQESTYVSPTGASAFAGSMVMDKNGYIGLGYTTVSETQRIAINFTGRYSNDPLNIMSVPESLIAQSSSDNPFNRYADYTHLTLDPSDEETFWFISEYFNPNRTDVVSAFKLAPNLDNDVHIIEILNPISGQLTASEPITVVIRNNGMAVQSNFEVSYQVNQGTLITETFTGSLAFNETAEFTFNETADFSEDGAIYTITAATNLAGDENPDNDAETTSVQNLLDFDIGVSDIIAPVSGSDLTASEPVTIEITNYGGLTQSNFPVSYSISGGSEVTETFTGSIEPLGKVEYTFTQTADFSASGIYELVAQTQLENDADVSNDSFITQVLTYCIPESECEDFNDGVVQLSLGDSQIETACSDTGYSNNTDVIFSVNIQDDPIGGTLQVGFQGSAYAIFIDFDKSGTFEPAELVSTDFVVTANNDFEFTIDLPDGIELGDYVMRVRGEDEDFDGDVTDPCENLEFGRTNDYTLRIFDSLSTEENIFDGNELDIVEYEPNKFTISLRSQQITDDIELSVYNLLGQTMVYNWIANEGGIYKYDLDMSYAATGVYVVRLGNSQGGSTKKIVVK